MPLPEFFEILKCLSGNIDCIAACGRVIDNILA
jgi:hypothetical protein